MANPQSAELALAEELSRCAELITEIHKNVQKRLNLTLKPDWGDVGDAARLRVLLQQAREVSEQ